MVSITDILSAKQRISGYVFRTPCYHSLFFSKKIGAEIFLKIESFQPTGVFKIRGAFNIILEKLEQVRQTGVVTASSGNHGLSVSYAARRLDVRCTVVVTKNANHDKVKMIRLYGAEVVEGGPTSDSIISQARELSKEKGLFFVHPFDDPSVISGQGTIGLEIVEDLLKVDSVLVPVGGGGLISGISTAVRAMAPNCRVVGVEPTGVPSLYESLKKGELVTVKEPRTIADGLVGQTIGKLDFEIIKQNVRDVVLVTDTEMREAVKALLVESHLLIEPSGAAPVAALLSGAFVPKPGERVALILSGGNIAYTLLQDLLNEIYPNRVSHG